MTAAPRTLAQIVDMTLRPLRNAARALKSQGLAESTNAIDQPDISAAAASDQSGAPSQEASTHVVFLPRDPQWGYCFWSIDAADQERARALGATLLCLRLEDVTGLDGNRAHPHALMELVVNQKAHEWYLPVPVADRDHRSELGYPRTNGGWLAPAMSPSARVPGPGPTGGFADGHAPFSPSHSPPANCSTRTLSWYGLP